MRHEASIIPPRLPRTPHNLSGTCAGQRCSQGHLITVFHTKRGAKRTGIRATAFRSRSASVTPPTPTCACEPAALNNHLHLVLREIFHHPFCSYERSSPEERVEGADREDHPYCLRMSCIGTLGQNQGCGGFMFAGGLPCTERRKGRGRGSVRTTGGKVDAASAGTNVHCRNVIEPDVLNHSSARRQEQCINSSWMT